MPPRATPTQPRMLQFHPGTPPPSQGEGATLRGQGRSKRTMLPPSEPGSVPGSVPSSSDESHFPPEIRLQLLRVAGGGTHQIHTAHPAAAGAPTASANGEPHAETTGLAASPSFTAAKTSWRWGLGRLGAPRCRRHCRSLWPRRSRSWGPSLSLKIVGWGQSQSCRRGARVTVPRWWCQGGETTVSAPSLPSGPICHA